jgi:hypothetical protein
MIKFDIPAKLDGAVLIQELNAVGILVAPNPTYGTACPTIWEGNLYLDISPQDTEKASDVIAAHNG